MSKTDCEHDKFEENGDGSMTCLDCRLEFRPEEVCEHDSMTEVHYNADMLVCLDCGLEIPSFKALLSEGQKEDNSNETDK